MTRCQFARGFRAFFEGDHGGPEGAFPRFRMGGQETLGRVKMPDSATKFADRPLVGFRERAAAFRASQLSAARFHRRVSFMVLRLDRLAGQGDQQRSHLLQRHRMIDRHVLKRVSRHVRQHGVRGFLHDGLAAALLDFPKAGGAVVEASREDHADNPGAIGQGRGAKQGIHGGAMTVFLWTRAELDASLVDEQMLVGRRHINMAVPDRAAVRRISGNLLALQAGRCRTTKTAAGKSGGSPETTRLSASTPPAEAPITMMSAACMVTIVSLSFPASIFERAASPSANGFHRGSVLLMICTDSPPPPGKCCSAAANTSRMLSTAARSEPGHSALY